MVQRQCCSLLDVGSNFSNFLLVPGRLPHPNLESTFQTLLLIFLHGVCGDDEVKCSSRE